MCVFYKIKKYLIFSNNLCYFFIKIYYLRNLILECDDFIFEQIITLYF